MLHILTDVDRYTEASRLDVLGLTTCPDIEDHYDAMVWVVGPDRRPDGPYPLKRLSLELLANRLIEIATMHGLDGHGGPLPVYIENCPPKLLARFTVWRAPTSVT